MLMQTCPLDYLYRIFPSHLGRTCYLRSHPETLGIFDESQFAPFPFQSTCHGDPYLIWEATPEDNIFFLIKKRKLILLAFCIFNFLEILYSIRKEPKSCVICVQAEVNGMGLYTARTNDFSGIQICTHNRQ